MESERQTGVRNAALDATDEASIAKFQTAFNELVREGHDPRAVAHAVITAGLGAMMQLEGAEFVGRLLAEMATRIAALPPGEAMGVH